MQQRLGLGEENPRAVRCDHHPLTELLLPLQKYDGLPRIFLRRRDGEPYGLEDPTLH